MNQRNKIITGVLLLLILALGLMWFWGGGMNEQRENRKLKKELKELEAEKREIGKQFSALQREYALLVESGEAIKTVIDKKDEEKKALAGELKKVKRELSKAREIYPASPMDTLCDNVIEVQDSIIEVQNVEIVLRDSLIENKDQQIDNLSGQVSAQMELNRIMNGEVSIHKDIISNKDLQIKRLRTKNIIVGTSAGAVVAGLILGLIFVK